VDDDLLLFWFGRRTIPENEKIIGKKKETRIICKEKILTSLRKKREFTSQHHKALHICVRLSINLSRFR
jgi:hypothetical protein